jgi:hypothetical protein
LSTLVPVIPAEAGIQAVLELEPKTNLGAGVRQHDELHFANDCPRGSPVTVISTSLLAPALTLRHQLDRTWTVSDLGSLRNVNRSQEHYTHRRELV